MKGSIEKPFKWLREETSKRLQWSIVPLTWLKPGGNEILN